MSASPEDIARVKWNRAADMYNQWETLDDEEKRELIARESPLVVTKLTPKRVTPEMINDEFPARYKLIGGGRAGKTEAVRIMMAREVATPANLLPENPTRFDYLHAIRAAASRSGADEIYHLADAAMQMGDAAVDESNIADLNRRLAERTAECEEQARLLGMSSEREARLIAERDALVEALRRLVNMKDERSIQDISNEELDNWRLADEALAAVKGGSHE